MASSPEGKFRVSRRRLAVALAVFALLSPGCRTWNSFKERTNRIRTALFETGYEDPRAYEKLSAAEELFAAGRYKKAMNEFRSLADNQYNPTDLAERARFMQAECRYARGEFPDAVDSYHRLLKDFPTGAHRREACARMFEICDYWLDDFRVELQKRSGEGGVLAWRPDPLKNPFDKTKPWIGQEGRTLEALDHIWVGDMTGPTADKALFWCGFVNFVRGNFDEADHFFSTLCEFHKESPLRPQAMAYAIQAKNNATGGADYDSRKCAEALQLVHTAEASVPELTQDPEMAAKLTRAKIAIRYQQAEKDLRMAEYYERTGHPGSAVFYYELVRRRYGGTRYSDMAGDRKEQLIAAMKAGRPTPGNDPFAIVQAKWKELFGRDASGAVVPAGGEQPPEADPPRDQLREGPATPGYGAPAGVGNGVVGARPGSVPGQP
jgi:outer membrane protein assembly factor BamD (BamD/ComL family)